MTTQPGEVGIRLPTLLRAYVIAFLAFWIGMVTWIAMIRRHGPSIAIGVVFIAYGLAVGYRLIRLGVTSAPDGTLTVRNNFGTRQLSRASIEAFRLGKSGSTRLGTQSIQALLRDGTMYSLDVTRSSLGLGRRRNQESLDALTKWLNAPS